MKLSIALLICASAASTGCLSHQTQGVAGYPTITCYEADGTITVARRDGTILFRTGQQPTPKGGGGVSDSCRMAQR